MEPMPQGGDGEDIVIVIVVPVTSILPLGVIPLCSRTMTHFSSPGLPAARLAVGLPRRQPPEHATLAALPL